MNKTRGLWKCPKCGHRFASRNLSHSCVNVRLADHFRKRAPVVRELFNGLRTMARSCGPVTVYAQTTRVVFQARVRFATAVTHNDWLEVTIWIGRRARHRCLHRVESFGRLGYVLHLRLAAMTDLDDDLRALLCESYQEHVRR